MKVKQLREDARIPRRGHPTDAGIDLFYAGDKSVIIWPFTNKILGTGFAFEVLDGMFVRVSNRSSVAAKRSLLVGAEVVDPGYSGEVFVDLHNVGWFPRIVRPGDKIAQAICQPFSCENIEIAREIYEGKSTIRGDGALGSTGNS